VWPAAAFATSSQAGVRGRLPLLFVHAIRFDKVVGGMGTKEVASAFGTSVGKVFDIRKNRNFGYVTEAYKPTADDVAAAKAWIEQVGGQNAKGLVAQGDSALMSRIVGEYERRGLASADEAKAFAEARTATRTKPEKNHGPRTNSRGTAKSHCLLDTRLNCPLLVEPSSTSADNPGTARRPKCPNQQPRRGKRRRSRMPR
jgi:hypothetical protein